MDELRKRLFEAMRNDLFCMAEYDDNEIALLEELNNSDMEILKEYADVYLS